MGVSINGPTYIFGGNMSVIFNTHIPTLLNYADLLMKVLQYQKRRNLVNTILFEIYEYDLNIMTPDWPNFGLQV